MTLIVYLPVLYPCFMGSDRSVMSKPPVSMVTKQLVVWHHSCVRLGVCYYKKMTSHGNFTKEFGRWGIDICFLSLIRNTFDFSVSGSFSTRLALRVIFFEILNSDNYKLQAFDVTVDLSYTGWFRKDWTFSRILYSVTGSPIVTEMTADFKCQNPGEKQWMF